MKRQIRRNVFETNSSSMHSLVVMRKDERYTQEEISKGIYLSKDKETGEKCVWKIWDDDELYYGRSPFKVLFSFKDKWKYAMASLVLEYNDKIYKELLNIAMKNIPGLKKIKLPTIIKYFPNVQSEKYIDSDYAKKYGKTEEELVKYLRKKEEEWELDEEIGYWEDCYGDWCFDMPHTGMADENILSGFLEKENIILEEFLLNKRYIVVVDGDEYCIYNDMKKVGLIDKNAIDHEYPKEED